MQVQSHILLPHRNKGLMFGFFLSNNWNMGNKLKFLVDDHDMVQTYCCFTYCLSYKTSCDPHWLNTIYFFKVEKIWIWNMDHMKIVVQWLYLSMPIVYLIWIYTWEKKPRRINCHSLTKASLGVYYLHNWAQGLTFCL